MMDAGGPPIGYHRWHASIRAIQLLNIGDHDWWEQLDRILGLAWAIQSFAMPVQQDVANPHMADTDLQDLGGAWLQLSGTARDPQFDLPLGPPGFGYHPSPKQPTFVA
jgi:hypothetical protein